MKIPVSSITGKPMEVVYTPDTFEFRGEAYDAMYVAFRDENGDEFTTTESDMVWYNQATNQYREQHGIPYVDEIVALRKYYGLSATKMSDVLGFGVNQWRLYEQGEVPSVSNGKLIRSAMNPRVMLDFIKSSYGEFAEKEYERLVEVAQSAINDRDNFHKEENDVARLFATGRGIGNGFAPQSISRLRNVILFVLSEFGEAFSTQMNKLLFYIDFLSYRERGIAITGLSYRAINYGPVPVRYGRVYNEFDEVENIPRMLHDFEGTVLTSTVPPNSGLFSNDELETMKKVCDYFKGKSSQKMSGISHKEPAWENYRGGGCTIPFKEAFSIVAL